MCRGGAKCPCPIVGVKSTCTLGLCGREWKPAAGGRVEPAPHPRVTDNSAPDALAARAQVAADAGARLLVESAWPRTRPRYWCRRMGTGTIAAMFEDARAVEVSPEARAKVIRSALNGRLLKAKMTAGQRRAVQYAAQSHQAS